jgi:putative restriction endonuclease
MDLIDQGIITSNFIEPSFELVDSFNGYWNAVMPPGSSTSMAYPFPRLKTDGFWERIVNPGFDSELDYNVSSMARLREIYAGAKMDEELFYLMCDPTGRERLRIVLIDTYFSSDFRPKVAEVGVVNRAVYHYRNKLIGVEESLKEFEKTPNDTEKDPVIRDQGFRKAIVALYDHRCALCGIRILTPEGHTVIEAAHVIPWSRSHDDSPTNGMALCRLCHWSFDEGLMGVGNDYDVLISPRVSIDRNLPGHMLTLKDRQIFTPKEEINRPGQINLSWHRENKFLR